MMAHSKGLVELVIFTYTLCDTNGMWGIWGMNTIYWSADRVMYKLGLQEMSENKWESMKNSLRFA